ncbi:hypothetical protein ACFOJ6_08930 [Gordonia humi]|uniref:hypothetical protein n=1 Tax=Gordonia humi TaxID=686429 RepID=UPI003605D2CA
MFDRVPLSEGEPRDEGRTGDVVEHQIHRIVTGDRWHGIAEPSTEAAARPAADQMLDPRTPGLGFYPQNVPPRIDVETHPARREGLRRAVLGRPQISPATVEVQVGAPPVRPAHVDRRGATNRPRTSSRCRLPGAVHPRTRIREVRCGNVVRKFLGHVDTSSAQ